MVEDLRMEIPREGLIRQELISYERDKTGKLMKKTTVRIYMEDDDYQDHYISEPLVWEKDQVY